MSTFEKDVSGAERFIEKARQYTEITEITAEILWAFIERIEIGERAEKHRHYTSQEVLIYYRDIGLLDEMPANKIKNFRNPSLVESDLSINPQIVKIQFLMIWGGSFLQIYGPLDI